MEIAHQLEINASPETVYKAVATQQGINGWWSKDCKVAEKEGGNSLLKFNKEGKIVEMGFKTISLVPATKAVWECTENANPAWIGTRVVTEISSEGGVSKVLFSHTNFDEKWRGQDPFEMTKQGWEHFVSSLKSYCENGEGQPW